ncbi:MAG: DnaJ domain-containing protein [Fluviicola sp.]|nr:DnaJ domain-containing protein [Fluviicola sp.]
MPRSKYYRILGLSASASPQEVKKQYRKLVMQYHPDRNSSANAEEKFIQLSEAYDIIINNKLPAGIQPNSPEAIKKDRAERMKVARQRFKDQEMRERLENERYFQFLTSGRKWKTLKILTVAGCILTAMLLLDIVLPKHYEQDEITEYRLQIGNAPGGKLLSLAKTRKGNYYWIGNMTSSLFSKTRLISIEKSWFFHSPVQIITRDKIQPEYFSTHFTFYSVTWLLVVFFLAPLFTVLYKRKTIGFTFIFHFCYYTVSALMLIFLITNNRWAHILTFGFI